MARFNLRYQISLFADFSTLSPSEEVYNQFENSFPNCRLVHVPFLENIVTESGTKTRECIKVSSINNTVSVEFRYDRVTFSWLNTDINKIEDISIGIFASNVIEVINQVDILRNTHYRRIGYVRYSLYNSPKPEIVYSHLNKTIPLLENLSKNDWTDYLPTRFVDNNRNEYNIVTTVKHATGPIKMDGVIKSYDGIFISIDVNTPDEERNYIYNYENLKSKIDSLKDLEKKVSSQYLELLNNLDHAE